MRSIVCREVRQRRACAARAPGGQSARWRGEFFWGERDRSGKAVCAGTQVRARVIFDR